MHLEGLYTLTPPDTMATSHRLPLLTLMTLVVGGGCGDGASPPPAGTESGEVEATELPATRDGVLVVEGAAEPVTLHLFHSPEGFPLPFHTYLPPGIQPASPLEGEVGFLAAFHGEADPRARLVISLLPPDATPEELVQLVEQEVRARGGEPAPDLQGSDGEEPRSLRRFPWAQAEWWISTPAEETVMLLGEHDGRPFVLEVAHPPELEEGFLPRVGWTLEEWRWAPGETPLIPSPPGVGWGGE
ncbi:MAG: hypothetical protein WEA09_03120 [Gemmatimonadota bacterium]